MARLLRFLPVLANLLPWLLYFSQVVTARLVKRNPRSLFKQSFGNLPESDQKVFRADPNVPPAMGRYLVKSIPGCQATFIPGAGHTVVYSHWGEIVTRLTKPERTIESPSQETIKG